MKHQLEQYYTKADDECWSKLVEYAALHWNDSTTQSQLMAQLLGKKDIAMVIYFTLGEANTNQWIHTKIPVLDNLSPIECLETETTIQRLKIALMRMY
jgi:uncharacterized protein (DUF2384 family)